MKLVADGGEDQVRLDNPGIRWTTIEGTEPKPGVKNNLTYEEVKEVLVRNSDRVKLEDDRNEEIEIIDNGREVVELLEEAEDSHPAIQTEMQGFETEVDESEGRVDYGFDLNIDINESKIAEAFHRENRDMDYEETFRTVTDSFLEYLVLRTSNEYNRITGSDEEQAPDAGSYQRFTEKLEDYTGQIRIDGTVHFGEEIPNNTPGEEVTYGDLLDSLEG